MKKMLIVEDDDLSQSVLRRLFRDEFEIDFCESAEEYYNNFSNVCYNVIIMDISLKGSKNGLELIKEIKSSPSYIETPILCLTAHAQTRMRQTAIESGSDLFITKPVPNNILKDAVLNLLLSHS